jgi:hypothetical protein
MAHAVAGRVGHASSNAWEASDIGQAHLVEPETCLDRLGQLASYTAAAGLAHPEASIVWIKF